MPNFTVIAYRPNYSYYTDESTDSDIEILIDDDYDTIVKFWTRFYIYNKSNQDFRRSDRYSDVIYENYEMTLIVDGKELYENYDELYDTINADAISTFNAIEEEKIAAAAKLREIELAQAEKIAEKKRADRIASDIALLKHLQEQYKDHIIHEK